MSVQSIIFAIVAGLISSNFFVFISQGGVGATIGVYISSLPLALSGLALGLHYCLFSIIAGLAFLVLSGKTEVAIFFAIIDALPIIILVGLFLFNKKTKKTRTEKSKKEWFDLGKILAIMGTLTAIAMFVFVKLILLSNVGEEALSLRDFCYNFLNNLMAEALYDKPEMHKKILETFVPILPSLVMIIWFLRFIFSVLIAQVIAEKIGKSIRPKPDYNNIILPDWSIGIFVLSVIAFLVLKDDNSYILKNAAAVLAMPIILFGLTKANYRMSKSKFSIIFKMLFYTVFILESILFGTQWSLLVVLIVGLVEHILQNHRNLFKKIGVMEE